MSTSVLGTPAGEEPVPPLLRLPLVLRRRIYRLVDLTWSDGAPHVFDLYGRDPKIRRHHPFEEGRRYPHQNSSLCTISSSQAPAALIRSSKLV